MISKKFEFSLFNLILFLTTEYLFKIQINPELENKIKSITTGIRAHTYLNPLPVKANAKIKALLPIVIEDNKGKLIFFKLSTNKPIKPFIEIN